jgi:hypothetical protein
MIINIDTNEESPERLRQIASFLERIASQNTEPSYEQPAVVSEKPSEPENPSEGAFDMFDMSSDRPSEVQKKPKEDSDDGFRMIPY